MLSLYQVRSEVVVAVASPLVLRRRRVKTRTNRFRLLRNRHQCRLRFRVSVDHCRRTGASVAAADLCLENESFRLIFFLVNCLFSF